MTDNEVQTKTERHKNHRHVIGGIGFGCILAGMALRVAIPANIKFATGLSVLGALIIIGEWIRAKK